MKVDRRELPHVEERLLAGQAPLGDFPILLEGVRHLRNCGRQARAATSNSERRSPRNSKRGKPKGHGRNGAEAYTGAVCVKVPHPTLKLGDPCPEGCGGKVYQVEPAAKVELKGAPPITATRYECEGLRCAKCQHMFTAALPNEASGAKYDASVDATLAVMRYAMGMPHHRLEQWQRWAGVPMPASTQFERIEVMADAVLPVFQHLQQLAANRALLHSDDTGARILSLRAENQTRTERERTGMFTTGIVAKHIDGNPESIVLYTSGRQHAGENMDQLLAQRAPEAGLALHMADASPMTARTERIEGNCMAHARRKFFELREDFPEHCERVLSDIATVYQNDAATRGLNANARLAYHQEHSRPVLRTLRVWIDEQFDQRLVEPNGRLGRAFRYMTKHWDGLTRFVAVPGVPIDNTHAEREIKPAQRHRKNSLFFKNEHGAAIGDVLMSAIRTCTNNGRDPLRYLTALATHKRRVRAGPQHWLPWNYEQQLAAPALN